MALIAKNITKVYKNGAKEVHAVDGVSLELEEGLAAAIVGPSGAGKSTLLHILGGLDQPTSGEVALDGANIYALSDSKRARLRNRRIGFVFQFYYLLPEFTALENVVLPALMRGHKSTRSQGHKFKTKAKEVLKQVGLENRIHHKPNELSGGESQRVAIARALMNDPDLLLCDEPTGNLDSKTRQGIYELLFTVAQEGKKTLVIVTHDDSISSRVQHTYRMRDGRIEI